MVLYMSEKTTIQVLKTTRELIAKHGIYRESYDDTIQRIFSSVAPGEFHEFTAQSKGRINLPSVKEGQVIQWRLKKG